MKKIISACVLSSVFLVTNISGYAEPITQSKDIQTTKSSEVVGHWAESAFKSLAEKGAIPFNEGDYMPDKAISRSDFVLMLHNALGIKIAYFALPDIKDFYTDVKKDTHYTSALIDLATANIIESGGSFKPENPVTREEMIHYIMNAYKYQMADKYQTVKILPSSFKDKDKINILYSGDVARAESLKLIQGVGGNQFNPTENATRAEAAVVIDKLTALLQKEINGIMITPSITLIEDTVELKLSIKNNLDKNIKINHTSGQKFDFVILDQNRKELYKWSSDKMFTMALSETNIEAGKPLEYTVMVDKDTYKNIKSNILYLKGYIIGTSDDFNINSEGYEVKIKGIK